MDLKVSQSATLNQLKSVLNAAVHGASPELAARIREVLPKVDDALMLRLLLEHTQARRKLAEQHLLLECYLRNGGSTHGDWLERLSATKPCKTIVAHIGKDTYGYWHPTEARALTIREAARVQSFPDFFRLDVAGVVDTYAVVGNAVPPLLSAEFAGRIEELADEWPLFGDAGVDPEATATRQKPVKQLQLSM
jgi:site-specific DNA-cytosine methylase